MDYSIIVPTLNRADDLRRALRSLATAVRCATSIEAEITIVDNGSVDDTKGAYGELRETFPECTWRYFYEPVPGLLSGRHRGALEAQGEFLIFVDDDIEATPGWLQAIADGFVDSDVKLMGGRNLPKYEAEPPAWLSSFWKTTRYGGTACHWLSLLDLGDKPLEIHPKYVWGLNFAIRRAALMELGGFHPDIVPVSLQRLQGDGETGLTRKAHERGYRALYCPAATIYHCVPASRLTARYFERRAFYQGVCDSYSEVRRTGRVEASSGVHHSRTVTNLANNLRQHAKETTSVHYLNDLIRRPTRASLSSAQASAIRCRTKRTYKEGYEFHQNAVRADPALLRWVLRPDYWDYRLEFSSKTESLLQPISRAAQTGGLIGSAFLDWHLWT
jgi:glycosyltransferase involved in cell wall biosynthesis